MARFYHFWLKLLLGYMSNKLKGLWIYCCLAELLPFFFYIYIFKFLVIILLTQGLIERMERKSFCLSTY